MTWLKVGLDLMLLCIGAIQLLYAYRVLGKPAGADVAYDAVMARQSVLLKTTGGLTLILAIFGLVTGMLDRLWV